MAESYRIVRDELAAYGAGLDEKPVVVGLNKIDTLVWTLCIENQRSLINGMSDILCVFVDHLLAATKKSIRLKRKLSVKLTSIFCWSAHLTVFSVRLCLRVRNMESNAECWNYLLWVSHSPRGEAAESWNYQWVSHRERGRSNEITYEWVTGRVWRSGELKT